MICPMVTETISPAKLRTIHRVNDAAKLERLVAAMQAEGWTGRPILAHQDCNGACAWTGVHRINAARLAGIDVPVVWITGDVERAGDDCFDDDDRMAELVAAEDADAIELMQIELDEAN